MTPKISIIIPFYNTPHLLLRKAFDNLLNQSFNDFEMIIINDGSTKDYTELQKEYESRDKRVHFIYQENSGVSLARNLGIATAKGEYIVFHDADDFTENNYLYSLYMETKKADLVICGIAAQWFPSVDSYIDIREFLSTPSTYNHIQYTNFTPNKIFKKEILIKNNILFNKDIKLGEDALFVAEYLKHCKRIRTIPQRLYYYIPHHSSATRSYNEKYWEYEKKVIDTQIDLFNTYPLNNKEQYFMQHWMYCKFIGALFYYIYWCDKESYKTKILKDIFDNQHFQKLLENSYDENPYFTGNDKFFIFIWKKFGLKGIYLTYYMRVNKFGGIVRRVGKFPFISIEKFKKLLANMKEYKEIF